MLFATAIEALRKEWEDIIRAAEDAWREAEEEWLAAAMAKNVRDMTQAEMARLRGSLKVRVIPFSPPLLPAGS